ncbi:MAG TPA: NUDIX domain-containing protein [Terriglobales bacterium]|jgi:8-oxo-dGTP pyrophosphatase MutT (NUDIX family)
MRREAESGIIVKGTGARAPRFFRVSELRRMKGREQVAAVCYRRRKSRVEFLLVRSGGGRWIFPKGSVEPGMSPAQAAALEAVEEAGVHGRMEEACFAHFVHRRGGDRETRRAKDEIRIGAYLCEVRRLGRPKEAHRKPTWFSAEKTPIHLQQGRDPEAGAELIQVVELALARIRRLANVCDNQEWRRTVMEPSRPPAIISRFAAAAIAWRGAWQDGGRAPAGLPDNPASGRRLLRGRIAQRSTNTVQ